MGPHRAQRCGVLVDANPNRSNRKAIGWKNEEHQKKLGRLSPNVPHLAKWEDSIADQRGKRLGLRATQGPHRARWPNPGTRSEAPRSGSVFGEPHGHLAWPDEQARPIAHVWMSERIGFTSKRAGIGEDLLSTERRLQL